MIMFISPAIVAKANMLGLESVSDMNNDGHITMEDVNLQAAKEGKALAASVAPVAPADPVDNPIVKEQVAISAAQ